jgi:hypothetical protein
MIIKNIGYLKLNSVLELEHFSIYETHKKIQMRKIYKIIWKLLE